MSYFIFVILSELSHVQCWLRVGIGIHSIVCTLLFGFSINILFVRAPAHPGYPGSERHKMIVRLFD